MKKTLAVDMDEVLAGYTKKVLETLQHETGIQIELKTVEGNFLSKSLDPQLVEIVSSYPYRKGFFRDLEVIPGSQHALESLSDDYDILIVSACMQHPNSLNDKLSWLNEYFPFIPFQKIIFCGEKKFISADYMIDDHPRHLETFKGIPLLFTAFHNINESRFRRFEDWHGLEKFLLNQGH